MNSNEPETARLNTSRPVLVWVISIFCFLATCFSLFTLWLSHGANPQAMSEEQRQFFASQTPLDYAIAFGTVLANMLGALCLFFMRRVALYFFVGSFVVALLHTIYNCVANNFLGVIGVSGMAIAVVGWAVDLAIILYVWSLARREMLH